MRRLFDLDDEEKPFIARWNALTRVLLVESSVKLVARTAMDYADFKDGTDCRPSNERLERETGLSDKTIRNAWAVMRGLAMAQKVVHGVGHLHIADEYQLLIPGNWKNLPILGPHAKKFNCLACNRLITPQGNCKVRPRPDAQPGTVDVSFDLTRMCFCLPPRARNGRAADDCHDLWNHREASANRPAFRARGREQWDLFRQARGDEW